MMEFVQTLSGILWGTPLLATVLFSGLFYTLISRFFSFAYFGHMLKNTLGTLLKKDDSKEKGEGKISPFEAVAVAIGGAVGVGNIGGVSTAIATGGPGAIFWIWLWAIFGMTIKTAEVALAVYFRNKDENGNYFGGPTYYMAKAMGKEMKMGFWPILAVIFGIGLFASSLSGAQTFTIAESLNTAFGVPMMPFTIAYSLFIGVVIWRGVTSIAAFASKIVPLMCLLYLVGGLFIIVMNISTIPSVIGMIFTHAFTGTAAIGGFAGAAFAEVIRTGIARSIYSNEAGWGSSPHAHASANTPHPIRQGLWGSFEVFVDTILVCTITALAILCAGGGTVWHSGISGASLAIEAFSVTFGFAGQAFIAIAVFLFGMTTTTGWFLYYEVLLRHLFTKNPKLKDTVIAIWKPVYVIPGLINVYIAVTGGLGPEFMWLVADTINAIPTFINCFVLIIIHKFFLILLNDYKARYLGKGTVDPNFKVFYDAE